MGSISPAVVGKDTDEKSFVRSQFLSAFAPPELTDSVTTLRTSLTDVFEFRNGGLAGTILKTVTITYLTASKKDIDTVEVS